MRFGNTIDLKRILLLFIPLVLIPCPSQMEEAGAPSNGLRHLHLVREEDDLEVENSKLPSIDLFPCHHIPDDFIHCIWLTKKIYPTMHRRSGCAFVESFVLMGLVRFCDTMVFERRMYGVRIMSKGAMLCFEAYTRVYRGAVWFCFFSDILMSSEWVPGWDSMNTCNAST